MALAQDYKVICKNNIHITEIRNKGQIIWPTHVELPPDPREPLYFDYSDKEYYSFWTNFIWSGGPEIDIYYSTEKVSNDPSRDWNWENYRWNYLGKLSEDNPQFSITGTYGKTRVWIKAVCQYTWANSRSEYNYIETNAKVIGGNIMSLVGNYYSDPDDYSMNQYCFANLFSASWVESIDRIVLPATTVSSYGYYNLFNNCPLITKAPELPATKIYQGAYSGMFWGCSYLTKAPELHVTELANSCFNNMFRGCSSLTQAPQLPYTTLADYCYNGMFAGCSSLTQTPVLPATNMSNYSPYYEMFRGCTSLTTAPELPATTISSGCYSYMFAGCTSLTSAPVLPATALKTNCYGHMFDGCSNLSYVKCLASSNVQTSSTTDWLKNVSASGTFVKKSGVSWSTGTSGIPSGWTVQNV